jgi:hypothetical protein
MLFIETPIFTRRIQEILSDDEYPLLQQALSASPDAGKIIPGSGGLRKIRWRFPGAGKRGGIRVIYYAWKETSKILFLFVFSKSEQDNLTPAQLKQIRSMVEREYL